MLQLHSRTQGALQNAATYENAHGASCTEGGGPDMHQPVRTAPAVRLRKALRVTFGVALAALVLLGVSSTARAASIVYRFQAQIQGGDNADGLLDPIGGVNVGSTASGYFVVDDTALDTNGASTFGLYEFAVIAVSIDLGGLAFDITAPLSGTTNDLFVLDDHVLGPGPVDAYATDVFDAPGSLGATALVDADLHFTIASSNTLLWATDGIPAAQPLAQAGAFDRLNEFRIEGTTAASDYFRLTGIITQVPEPGTGLMLALGLVGLAIRRRA